MKISAGYESATTPIESGITLIEASAGTGKTFAIAMLVLRAVVEKEIPIERILVVTYTVAATEELRQRIRRRLQQGRELLLGTGDGDDQVLLRWAAGVTDRKRAAALIKLALDQVDLAGIYTIHGFAQRMLSEQALESGQLFDFELTGDARAMTLELVQDYWRSRVYPLKYRYCSVLLSRYGAPESLYRSIAGGEDLLAVLIPEQGQLNQAMAGFDRALEELLDWWRRYGTELRTRMDQAAAGGYLNQALAEGYQEWCAALEGAATGSSAPEVEAVRWLEHHQLLAGLNGRKLRGSGSKEAFIEDWPLAGEVAVAYGAAVEHYLLEVRLDLARHLRAALGRRLEERGLISFDQLVIRLADRVAAPDGQELRRLIRRRYRVALIDEFQDTDSAQWQIFSRLFGSSPHCLYLIGDPKQAIYRFRGADIYSYYQAKNRADRTFTLGYNYRSNPGLVEALNRLFARSTIAGSRFSPTEPARTEADGRLLRAGVSQPPLVYCSLDPPPEKSGWGSAAAMERISCWVTGEISRLLDGGNEWAVEQVGPDGSSERTGLRPMDIAVLVRTNKQGEAYRNALSQANIPAVLASRTSVFATPDCEDLLAVLQAAANPGDIRLLKSALSRDWFGLSGAEFQALCSDPLLLDSWVERFAGYHELWLNQGVLSMLTRLLGREQVFVKLCFDYRAERRLANIQHLAELIQQTERQRRFGPSRMVTWLQRMMGGAADMDETELRLESDAEAVSVITMHSAKGLEYPIVFCPALHQATIRGRSRSISRCHDREQRLVVDLGSEHFQEHQERDRQESEEEELRLAYVALTRARLRCYLFWAEVESRGSSPGSSCSPLGRLLGGSEGVDHLEQLRSLGGSAGATLIRVGARSDSGVPQPWFPERCSPLRARSRTARSLGAARTLTSFTGLINLSRQRDELPPGAFDESPVTALPSAQDPLPGGVRLGNTVHEALERYAFAELAENRIKTEELRLLCRRHGLVIVPELLAQLLKNCVSTPLPLPVAKPEAIRLADLDVRRQVKELPFTLSMQGMDTRKINRILAADKACAQLGPFRSSGYLNGYVDLVFEHRGRYYIADYKTNFLGTEAADYSREGLAAAMRGHNYGLQYWLYTLAAHRHLHRWLPRYRYQDHFGGVLYLFVRGMDPERPGSGVYTVKPDAGQLEQLDRCFGGSRDG